MSGIYYEQSTLMCDGVALADLAGVVGTPCYVYSAARIRESFQAIDCAFGDYPHTVHYALKANSTLAIARLLRSIGSAADANSGGEIEVALRAGFIPPQIVFTGVGKTRDELERAVALGVRVINAESPLELDRIDQIARSQGTRARVALRVNPDIDAQSHPHISTGLKTNKFGVPLEDARAIYRGMAPRPGLDLTGIHIHVGSQITSLEPLTRAATAVLALTRELGDDGIRIEHLDVGGGLGISYNGSPVPAPAEYAEAILSVIRPSGLPLIVEPGRAIVGAAGLLIGRVVDVKAQAGEKQFVVLDAGMTELMRPALYGAFHRIEPLRRRDGPLHQVDIVGPICESSDVFGRDRALPSPEVDDLVAILDTGAYGSVMGSNYNRRPLPPEVLIDAGTWRIIRRRQTIDDLLALED